MNKTKIVFFIPQLIGGGAERVNINIMKLLDKSMFDIHLVVTTLKDSVYKELPEKVTLHNLNVNKTLFSIKKLRALFLDLSPEIVFSSLIRGHIAINLSLLGMKKKPYVILRSPNSPKLLIENNQMSFFQKFMLESAYKRANLIIAQTPEMKEEIVIYHGIERNKVNFLKNPLDIQNINQKIRNIKNPFKESNINVVAAGRITYQKGFDILIKSFKDVIKVNKAYKLHIIGQDDGKELMKLQKLVDTLDLCDYVSFLGYQDNPYRYFYFSDLYVLSSRWEGLPNTILENIYLKKPIISTKCIPYLSSLIKNGDNGFLVDVEDVEALSNSILNYKSLSLDFLEYVNPKQEINDFFKNLKV